MFAMILLACTSALTPSDNGESTDRALQLTADSADTAHAVDTPDTDATTDSAGWDSAPDTAPPRDTAQRDTGAADPMSCACPEGFEPTPAGEICQREFTRTPQNHGVQLKVCAIEPYFAYSQYGARYPGGEIVQDDYWGQSDGSALGRLNTSGVWTCEGALGDGPVDEWIGFSVCLELDEPGDLLVGLGADNSFRVRLDGALIIADESGETSAFNYWWVQAVSLISGRHILELEGKNLGSAAALGAELAGPFPAGSLTDDAAMLTADYAGELLWSSADTEGEIFDLGSTTGLSCPDGFALSRCDEEPACVKLETSECLQ